MIMVNGFSYKVVVKVKVFMYTCTFKYDIKLTLPVLVPYKASNVSE